MLANALTKHKTGEKEKFDAIFNWVAGHISYNYKAYYSSAGSYKTNVSDILKRRRGLCLDYATLMDTLCSLAGITNVSVYGYAKDEIFDVNDSIYMDNHAWNAVKLDGLWYVYDVTWASGELIYTYTGFSRLVANLQNKFEIKYKRKRIRNKRKDFKMEECYDSPPAYYYEQRFFNRRLELILSMPRPRIKHSYTHKINPGFYLTEPAVFAITHFPDNAAWSLVPGKTMRDFEADSSFYHLDNTTYAAQTKEGKLCPACDYDISLSQQEKKDYLKQQSFILNPKNHFITASFDYEIADINYKKMVSEDDSLTKSRLIDTTSFYLQSTLKNLRSSSGSVKTDFNLQKKKNQKKQNGLLKDNRKHISFIRSKIKITELTSRGLQSLDNKCKGNLRKYPRRKNDEQNLKSKIFVDERHAISPAKISELNKHLKQQKSAIDSLTNQIDLHKQKFDSCIISLSNIIWEKVKRHDSLITPIATSADLRKLEKDDLKKVIVEIRKQIPVYEIKYARDINQVVYDPTQLLSRTGAELFKLLDQRYAYENDLHHMQLLLVKFNSLPLSELSDHKKEMLDALKTDYCWIKEKLPFIKACTRGFIALKRKQADAIEIILAENDIERHRKHRIDKELLRRKKKYQRIISNNIHVSKIKLHDLKTDKRAWLKSLKDKRRTNS